MPRILISASFPEHELARQLPTDGRWDEFEFLFSPTDTPVDGWVVYDDLREPLEQICPRGNTLLITGEPAGVRRYRRRFTDQFAQVWTAQTQVRHRQVTYRNEAQPWHYALRPSESHGQPLDWEQLANLARPAKPKLLSVICSTKSLTPDHRQRQEFVRFLKAELGDVLHVYGRGILPIRDKADAIWPYQYHIALENDHSPHYMTEKLTDAYLGWSYPLYFGGEEAYHRFPEGSFTAIDIYKPRQALKIIRECLEADLFTSRAAQIAEARQAVLHENNLFARLASYWRNHMTTQPPAQVRLLPKSHRGGLILQQLGRSLPVRPTRKAA